MSALALVVGIFAVPLALLSIGHGFRSRTPRQRSLFWGGVFGYGVAVAVVTISLLADPVLWTDATPVRRAVIFWGLLAGGGIGTLLGALRPLPADGVDSRER